MNGKKKKTSNRCSSLLSSFCFFGLFIFLFCSCNSLPSRAFFALPLSILRSVFRASSLSRKRKIGKN